MNRYLGKNHMARSLVVLAHALACVMFLMLGVVAKADIQYQYDAGGKLIGIIDQSGNTAEYSYDAAGNILSIKRVSGTTLSMVSFAPVMGHAGDTISLYGTGFSLTPTSNVVRFNGVQALVSSSTATQLTVTVPSGASTGPISVTVGSSTVSSVASFVVSQALAKPSISSFTPTIGAVGSLVTIQGANFDPVLTRNAVLFGGMPASIQSVTTTSIVATVPNDAVSGPIQVETTAGAAQSAADFYILPAGAMASQIGVSQRNSVDAQPFSLNIPASQRGLILFNGVQGQSYGLAIANVSSYLSFYLVSSGGQTKLLNCTPYGSLYTCVIPPLPSTSTYSLEVLNSSGTAANLTLTLSRDVMGTLTANAAATTFSTARTGQNARYTFNATAGQNASLVWTGSTFSGPNNSLLIYKPDGTYLASYSISSSTPSGVLPLTNLQMTGAYTVFFQPYGGGTGQVSLQYDADSTATLAVDGAPMVVTQTAGQTGDYKFAGTVGQKLGVGLSGVTLTPSASTLSVSVIGPDNATVITYCDWKTYGSSGGNCVIPPLPGTGTYTVRVTPLGTTAANLTLTLSSDVSGTLTANAAATTFSTARTGQNARYTFNATAGQNASLVWTGSTFSGPNNSLLIYKPDGTYLASYSISSSTPSGVLPLTNLQMTGAYTVFFQPYGGGTGQISLQYDADATATLAVDGAPVVVTQTGGQTGDYQFAGTLGQTLGLGLSGVTLAPSSGTLSVSVIGPDNTTVITYCGWMTYGSSGGACVVPALPSTGTYTVRVVPSGTTAANLTLTLSSDVSGTLTANAAATTFSNPTRTGRNARYTFNATAGQNASLVWSGATFAGSMNALTIYKPDGTYLTSPSFGSSTPSGVVPLTNLPMTGSYTVFVQPYGGGTGQVNLQYLQSGTTPPVSETVNGTLSVDGAASVVSLTGVGVANYTFSGTLGVSYGLGLSGVTLTPSSGNLSVSVIAPDNLTIITSCGGAIYGSNGHGCVIPPLPSTGTYTVRLTPSGTTAANLMLTLSSDVTGTLTANAVATTFSTVRTGQNARYTFNATAGQNASLVWTGSTFADNSSTNITIYKPDRTLLTSASLVSYSPSGAVPLANLPATGTYVVTIQSYWGGTGQVSLQYDADAAATLAVDGAPLAVTLSAGQTGDYKFAGTLGQQLGLGLSGVSLMPSTGTFSLSVIAPDNVTVITSCGGMTYSSSGGACVVPALPSSGIYTVRVRPSGATAANLTLTLSSDVTGTLTANAAATTFSNVTRTGRNARYTFNATAGQNASLVWSGSTFAASTSTVFTVYKPDGTLWVSRGLSSWLSGTIPLPNLPATGTYVVTIQSFWGETGQVSLQYDADAAATLAVDGAPLAASLTAGQTGDYKFAGTLGQHLGVGLSGVSLTPSSGTLSVSAIGPDNATIITSCGGMTYGSNGGACIIPALPSTGTYTVRLTPSGATAVNLTLTLSSDVAGTLTANAAATIFNTTRTGQNARYNFNATAGQNASLVWSGSTFPASTSTVLTVYKPDGTLWVSRGLSSWPSGAIPLPNMPATGTYVVTIQSYWGETGQVGLGLLTDLIGGALPTDGSTVSVTLPPWQAADYIFTGSVGQRIGLLFDQVITSVVGQTVTVSVYGPNNLLVVSCDASSANCRIPTLVDAGTYTVRLQTNGGYSASLLMSTGTPLAPAGGG